jgi:hypothetical protein
MRSAMARRTWLGLVLIMTWVAGPARALAGGLDRFDRTTTDHSARHSDEGRRDAGRRDDDSDAHHVERERNASRSGLGDSAGVFVFYVLASPWLLPRVADQPCAHAFAAYPDGQGFLRSAPWDTACGADLQGEPPRDSLALASVRRRLAGHVDLEGMAERHGLLGGALAGQLWLPKRFDLALRFSWLADFDQRPLEQAWLSNALVSYRFAQAPRFAFRSGLGVRTFYLGGLRAGVDTLYALDIFGPYGIRASFEGHLGGLGHAVVLEGRASLGVMAGPVEVYLGYSSLHSVGERASASLAGPVLGARLWL